MAELMTFPFWQWLPFLPWRVVGVVDSADYVPGRLPRNGAVLVGEKSRPKWIVFDCPCRTGHRIMLNTDKARLPHWSLSKSWKLTISPSVDYIPGVGRCHYFIRSGRVKWV